MIEPTYTVSELSRDVARVVARAFPQEVWVQGEIRDLNRAASGHVYFSLVDSSAADEASAGEAILPVTLFSSDREAVNRLLTRTGAVRMTDGIAVRIRGWVNHYAARGTVQLRMTWIDTEFTIGRLAAERDRIMRRLEREGLLEANRAIPFPSVPLRVGLITSVGSAAHADFLEELRSSGRAWQVDVADVRVQGADAERSILHALRLLAGRPLDVVAIVRGGGAQTDLAVFDSEAIARAVARYQRPVVTGIGHEVDSTVVDAVAACAFKTPTACGSGLVSRVEEFLAALDRTSGHVARAAARLVIASKVLLGERAHRVRAATGARSRAARTRVDAAEGRLADAAVLGPQRAATRLRHTGVAIARTAGFRSRELAHRLAGMERQAVRASDASLAAAAMRLATAQSRIEAQDPTRLLARGWSVTRTRDGRLVTEPEAVQVGDVLLTTVSGGEVKSVVAGDQPGVDVATPGGDV